MANEVEHIGILLGMNIETSAFLTGLRIYSVSSQMVYFRQIHIR